jgi:hypothetical protein
MSFIELSPDLKRTNELLERIAVALETSLYAEHKIRVGALTRPAADPNPAEKVTIGYASDEETAKQILTRIVKRGDAPDDPDAEEEVWMDE